MKKILLALLVYSIVFSMLAGCSSEGENPKDVSSPEVSAEPTVTPVSNAVDHGGYRPHYQGYGVNTPGGRGGAILRVTNLNDNGDGSLRAALEATGPRIVIFEISGMITLESPINITNPYITVAGQTAPSPGITVRYHPIFVKTHDVVVQHIRSQLGDTQKGGFAFSVSGKDCDNVVPDHLSMSWGTASLLAVVDNFKKVAVLDCMLSYTLNTHYLYTGQSALNAYSFQGEVTYARNLFVHNSNRLPWFGAGIRGSAINNVAYGTGNSGGDKNTQYGFLQIMVANYDFEGMSNSAWNTEAVALNNRFIPSYGTGKGSNMGTHPDTKSVDVCLIDNPASRGSRLYLSGNVGPHMTVDDQWGGVDFLDAEPRFGSRETLDYVTEPKWNSDFKYDLIPTDKVTDHVFANAGARPLDRDPVDVIAVSQAKAGLIQDTPSMGSRIYSQKEMGGWPVLAENKRALQVPENPNDVARGQTFRTNIELWLENYARELEPAQHLTLP